MPWHAYPLTTSGAVGEAGSRRLGQIDPALVTPVVEDIGEALVFKIAFDTGEEPSTERLAEIVDQAILPAVGIRPV